MIQALLIVVSLAFLVAGINLAGSRPLDQSRQLCLTHGRNSLLRGERLFLVLEGNVSITAQGYVLTSGEHIPFREALVSEDGRYWRCQRPDGSRRCFFAPRGGA